MASRISPGMQCEIRARIQEGSAYLRWSSVCSYASWLDAHGWAHAHRKLKEIFDRDDSEIAAEGPRRTAELYRIEAEIRSIGPGQRLFARLARSAPLIAEFDRLVAGTAPSSISQVAPRRTADLNPREETRRDVFDYIEMLDNPKRKHTREECCRPSSLRGSRN